MKGTTQMWSKHSLVLFFLVQTACMSPLLGQEAVSSLVSESQENRLQFTPESEGRRQISFRSPEQGYQWRLRIPERVFCDEGVLVGHDIHRVHTPVRWTKEEKGSWFYRRDNVEDTSRESVSLQIEYALRIQPSTFGANLFLSVKNTGKKILHNVTGHVCLGHLKDPFRDPDYQRTFILRQQQFLNLHETQRGSNPIRAHYRVRDQSAIKLFDNPDNRFWGPLSTEVADCGLILTQSREKNQLVALWFDPAAELFQNSDEPNMCIHSDPTFGDLQPGSSVEVKGRLILFDGNLKQFEKAFLK